MKKINMRSQSTPALGLLAKNTALLPSGIVCVQELQNTALNQVSPASSSGSATGNPRNKTVLAPGHSLMDWIRLGSTGKDLSGVGGKFLAVTPAELAKHNKENDAWIAIRGIVFNVSLYMNFHPGGVSELMKGVGKDATKLFENTHAWVNYQSILQKCLVGRLENSMNTEHYLKNATDHYKENNSKNKTIFDSSIIKIKWQQTMNSVSLIYSTPPENLADECQLKKKTDSEFSLQICYSKTEDIITFNVKLVEDVEWPPKWQRNNEIPEDEILFMKKDKGVWKIQEISLESHKINKSTKRTYNKYEVVENTLLCKIVHLLVLRAHNYIQLVPPGKHIEVKINVMGTEVSRLYTPVPYYLHPEERLTSVNSDDCLCLIIKCYENGAMSPRLTALQPGQFLELSNTLGNFHLEVFDKYTVMHFIAAGTGLTTMLSIIKRTLSRHNAPSIHLINFNTNEDNIFYSRQLDLLSKKCGLTVTHILSAPDSTWCGRAGIISNELLKDILGKHSKKACIFTCGPAGFMKIARESLRNLGWKSSQMHEFDG